MDPDSDVEYIGDELTNILENLSIKSEARSKGWDCILGLSACEEGLNHIIHTSKYVPFLCHYILKECEDMSDRSAYKCLINISTREDGAYAIIDSKRNICDYLLHTISDKNPKNVHLKCSLLANLSMYEEIAKKILQISQSSTGSFQKIIKVYCSSELKVRSQYDFLSFVFANVSRQVDGRRLFLQYTEFMIRLFNFTKPSESESRRLGTALILRNCCMETDYHDKLLKDLDILPALLMPLMTPKVYEEGGEMGSLPPDLQRRCLEEVKEWDPSPSVRRVLIQALVMLCYSESGWSFLKTNGVYYVLRDLHSWQGIDEATAELINQLVAFFLVVKYTQPTCSESFSIGDSNMIRDLEKDMNESLPDIFMSD